MANPRRNIALLTALTGFLLAGCSFGSADASTTVVGTNDSCTIADERLAAGKIDIEFSNQGDDVSELYVLLPNGDVVGEVENVTTGTVRTLTVDLSAGEYQVRCKPGQTGDGITSNFEVTGEGGTALADPDREITFEAIEFSYPGLDVSGIAAGDTIRFVLTNTGAQPHEFEVLDPGGEAIGEVASVPAGESGGATMVFETPGVYTYQCILVDPNTDQKHSELGMLGTFEVN